jgi:predicted RNase H-like nuclease (RuvC/YqgF family)
MSAIFKAMKEKKKRAVDPNAPPRPNLMTHDVKIRSAQEIIDAQAQQLQILQHRVDSLERKLSAQKDYLSQLHQRIARK